MSKQSLQQKPTAPPKPKSVKKRPKREMMVYGNAIKTEQAMYTIVDHLGSGGFGDVYKVYRNLEMNDFFALKTEEYNVPGRLNRLKMEAEVLQKCTDDPKPHFIQLVDKGRTTELKFIIMSMVGPTLDKVRSSLPNRQYTPPTASKICIQLLEAIRDLHGMGYLHRDLKPSNFAIGLHDQQRAIIFMLDFGIARPYLGKDGQLLLPRAKVAFMGTLRFAPIAAHMLKDQSRKDELESLLYVMADIFSERNLTWRGHKNITMLISLKQNFMNQMGECAQKILAGLPDGYKEVLTYVKMLAADTLPAYDFLIKEMARSVKECTLPLDWMAGNMCVEEAIGPKKTAMATVVTKEPSLSTMKDGAATSQKDATAILTTRTCPSVKSHTSAKSTKPVKSTQSIKSQKSLKKKASNTALDDRKATLAAIMAGHEKSRKKVVADKRSPDKGLSRMDKLIAEHEKKTQEEGKKPPSKE